MKTAPYVWNRSGVIVSLVAGGILLLFFLLGPLWYMCRKAYSGICWTFRAAGQGIAWLLIGALYSVYRAVDYLMGLFISDEELS